MMEKLDLDALEAEAVAAALGTGDRGSTEDSKRPPAIAKEEEAKTFEEDDDMVFGEDYKDLARCLEQARKLALKREDEPALSGPQAVALLAAAASKEQEDSRSLTQGRERQEPEESKVVITEMEEFVLGLQPTHEPEPEDVFKDEDDVCEHEMEVDITPDAIIHEAAVGKGLSGALGLLKDRGTLNETIEWGGRNMDKKKRKLVGIIDNDGSKEIRLERTDEFGRTLTPKEAFRVDSHKFHGKGPGKMKQEKRMKQYEEDLKKKQMKSSDTPLLAVERMRDTLAQLKSPYIVLSGLVKPRQTELP